ncbi:benzoate 4-monooxygenase cytochrome P450 [Metarhizium acridum CQMa 102]|uniref:Benzoate 4-monooxygenase cytochrome P450 n=1 Tax=Metarhizium acridum (strain CQMa 102) TaxID=655827 RepID=E9E7J8_METAQ|nr:benzoate 4-monooxygenase cytochrome P450 [Metarhizium acridum CQMa 102]EFY88108.1 benzoate 4-monooxygenase cytochrome P450 [Metarhizium acridum CQMa 102]
MLSDAALYGWLALPVIIAWFAANTYYGYRRLKHIPGPPGAGLSIWWLLRSTLGGRTHLDLYEVCRKYGPIARVGPNDVVTSDAKLAMHILGARSQYTRSSWYNGLRFEPGKNNIISMRDDALHAVMRSKMAGGYSGKEVEYLEFKIDKSVTNLVNLLDSYVRDGRPFDFARKIHFFALDVISELAFGEPFGDLTTDSDVHNLVTDIETYLPYLIVSTVMSWMIPVLGLPIFRPLMPSEHDVLGIGRLVGFVIRLTAVDDSILIPWWCRIAKRVAAERYGPSRKIQRDMVGSFVARGLTQEQTESEIAAQINGSIAGSDTTATGIRATFLHAITNPRVLARLQAEIQESELSWPVAADAEIRKMPFVQATIKEGLRMLPPVAGFMSKEVPADGDCWNGLSFPPGTRIGLCMMGIMRQRDVFGADADEFRPERWLGATPDMEATWGLVFGSGKWACLGKNIARMEMNKVLVEVRLFVDSLFCKNLSNWFALTLFDRS